MLTLGGLTIAIGRVIDDSIVVIENIYRHLQEGDSIRRAAYTGTREVAGAITASTLTTVAVFLPLGFVHGLASEFFRPFALTVTFALLCSLAVALMVVPVASTWLLSKRQVGHRDEKELTRLQNAYLPALNWAVDHKVVTIVAAGAIFVATMSLTPLLKTNLLDSSGQNTMGITQTLPPGTSLDATCGRGEQGRGGPQGHPGRGDLPVHGRQHGQSVRRRRRHGRVVQPGHLLRHHRPERGQERDHRDVPPRWPLSNAGTITVSGEDSTMGGGMRNWRYASRPPIRPSSSGQRLVLARR